MALDVGTVAWQTDNQLWRMNLESGQPEAIYKRPGYGIEAVSYSREVQAFLLAESTNKATTSLLITLSNAPSGLVRTELARKPTIRDVKWINQGRGYAYHVRQGQNNYLAVQPDSEKSEGTFFKKGGVVSIFSADGVGHAIAQAAVTNEPPSVWQCEGGDMVQLFAPLPEGHKLPPCQPALVGYAPYEKHNARFDLVPPANFSRQRKYPLVIGLASYTWSPVPHALTAQTLANCGAYVALSGFVFREDSAQAAREHLPQINAIYNLMAANPNVDTNRVFLFAFSASTAAACELVKQFPGRFRGIILLHPGELPAAADGMTQRVLFTAGSNEGATERIAQYQVELCKVGIPMLSFVHDGGGHIARAQRIMRERTELMAELVFEK